MGLRALLLIVVMALTQVSVPVSAKEPGSRDLSRWLQGVARNITAVTPQSLAIPGHERWFDQTFGDEAGRVFGSRYVEETSEFVKEFGARAASSRGRMRVAGTADSEWGVPIQLAHMIRRAMRKPIDVFVLYDPAERADSSDELLGFFVYQQNQFRYLGKWIAVAGSAGAQLRLLAASQRFQLPRLVHKERPAYPPLAKEARIAGVVYFKARIAADGSVRDVEILAGDPLLVAQTARSIERWKYAPALLDGQPVELVVVIPVFFTLVS